MIKSHNNVYRSKYIFNEMLEMKLINSFITWYKLKYKMFGKETNYHRNTYTNI